MRADVARAVTDAFPDRAPQILAALDSATKGYRRKRKDWLRERWRRASADALLSREVAAAEFRGMSLVREVLAEIRETRVAALSMARQPRLPRPSPPLDDILGGEDL